MSNKIFTQKEIEVLSKNQYVKNVSAKGITYTVEFKRIFIAEYEKGGFPREIFTDHGFDLSVLGISRVEASSKRWRAAYRKEGICGLNDTRKEKSGRLNEKNLSIEEKYERLLAHNNLLKAENELLKKIDIIERGMRRKK